MNESLKQRIVGGVVLSVAVLVVVPLWLGEPHRSAGPQNDRTPAPPAPAVSGFSSTIKPISPGSTTGSEGTSRAGVTLEPPATRVVPLPLPDAGRAPPVVVKAPVVRPPAPALASARPTPARPTPARPTPARPAPARSVPSGPAPAVRPPVAKPSGSSGGPFMVQLASFSKRDNALALRDALRSKGHNASVTTSADGTLHRLLVGPYRTPATAADAVIALRSETKLAGVVRRTDSL